MSLILRYISIFMYGLIVTLAASADTRVYISHDENGNLIFSDRKTEESQSIVVKDIAVVPALKLPQASNQSSPLSADTATEYHSLKILYPTNEYTLTPEATGNVVITGVLEPELKQGDIVLLKNGGEIIAQGSRPVFSLNNLERGEYGFSLSVQSSSGKTLISSDKLTLYVQRSRASR